MKPAESLILSMVMSADAEKLVRGFPDGMLRDVRDHLVVSAQRECAGFAGVMRGLITVECERRLLGVYEPVEERS